MVGGLFPSQPPCPPRRPHLSRPWATQTRGDPGDSGASPRYTCQVIIFQAYFKPLRIVLI